MTKLNRSMIPTFNFQQIGNLAAYFPTVTKETDNYSEIKKPTLSFVEFKRQG
jgi:hypothetical protein